jgi:hypothetical protein
VYDPDRKVFYQNVPSTTANPGGEVDVIDPHAKKVVKVYPVSGCFPAGIALSHDGHLLLACSGDAIAAGNPPQTLILEAASGTVLRAITEVGGSDQAAYDPNNNRFYVAARDYVSNGTKTPVLGVIDAANMKWIQNVPTGPSSKSVAADPQTNRVFVPLLNADNSPRGLGIYGSP